MVTKEMHLLEHAQLIQKKLLAVTKSQEGEIAKCIERAFEAGDN